MRSGSLQIVLLAVLCASLGACISGAPNIPPMPVDGGEGPAYADAVLSVSVGGKVIMCTAGLPNCMGKEQTCAGDPDVLAALGPPDGAAFQLGPNGVVVFGFQCSAILQANNAMETLDLSVLRNDLLITASTTGGASPIVELSLDDATYELANPWVERNNTESFSLASVNLQVARYVRITETAGKGAVQIDSLEALRGAP